MDEFRAKLLNISQELTTDDFQKLKVLYSDIIPTGRAELITTPLELFQELETKDELREDNLDSLAERLDNIGRRDLSHKLRATPRQKNSYQRIQQLQKELEEKRYELMKLQKELAKIDDQQMKLLENNLEDIKKELSLHWRYRAEIDDQLKKQLENPLEEKSDQLMKQLEKELEDIKKEQDLLRKYREDVKKEQDLLRKYREDIRKEQDLLWRDREEKHDQLMKELEMELEERHDQLIKELEKPLEEKRYELMKLQKELEDKRDQFMKELEKEIEKRDDQMIKELEKPLDTATPFSPDVEISIDKMGCSHDISRNGVFLDFPPNAVAERTVVTCNDRSKDFSPSPADADENLVSNIVELGPDDVDILQPITVSLMHSGPGRDLGYETIVRAFYKDKGVWAKLEELKDKSHLLKDCECDYIQVQISKLTALAVVTRLITDRLHATPRGCVVRSSVCQDVTVELPEGAVDKTVEGTMKLMLMPEDIHQTKDACPILCVDGFSKITFSKPVIVTMPKPNKGVGYSSKEIRILRLEDSKGEDNEWEDVTDQVHISENKTHIEFHVKRFSCLWPWKSKTKINFASTIFRHLRSPPRRVCFAAFKDNEEASLSVSKLTLVCVANHKQNETLESVMRGVDYSQLAVATGDQKMRPDDKAYPSVNGAEIYENEEIFLEFLDSEVCRKELCVRDAGQDEENLERVKINFFPNPEEKEVRLGTLQMNKKKVFSRSGGERPSGEAHQQEVEEQAQPLQAQASTKEKVGLKSGIKIEDVFGRYESFALGRRHEVSVSDVKKMITLLEHSVGAIIARDVSNKEECGATCFRIGTEYVITCKHVDDEIKSLDITWDNCYVDFNYEEQGPQPAERYRFRFAPNPVLAISDELDYIILKLNPEGRDLPPNVIENGFNIAPPGRQLQGGKYLTFIGHPGGRKKLMDITCPIKHEDAINEHLNLARQELRESEFQTCEAQVRNPNSAFYDVNTFYKGSSGSPGFLMKDKLLVVLHRRGILYKGNYVFEEGTLMASVFKDVMLKINNGTVQNVN